MTHHTDQPPPLPWTENQMLTVAPSVIGAPPLLCAITEHGLVQAMAAITDRGRLEQAAYTILTSLEIERFNQVAAVVFMADAARNVDALPYPPAAGDLVMLARDGDRRVVDTVAYTFVTIIETRCAVIDYQYRDGLLQFEEAFEVAEFTDTVTHPVLRGWSHAIETVTA